MLPSSSSSTSRRRSPLPLSPTFSRRRFPRSPQFFLLLFLVCTLLYLYTPLPFFFPLAALAPNGSNGLAVSSSSSGGVDRITLVVIWTGLNVPNYLGMFLRSVEANKDRVDLVFVAKRDETPEGKGRCVDLGETGANVRVVCLTNEEYWTLHQEYLCDRWKCTPHQKEELMGHLLHSGIEDYIHSHFRVLRGPVMQRYFIDQSSKWWGWCDTDVVLGNFERTFPWDIAHKFDLIQPSHDTTADEILVYFRGHMTVFQSRPSTLNKLHTFPAFQSYEAYMTGKKPVSAMEEEDFSTFFFHSNPQVTFLTYDALTTGHFQTVSLSPKLVSLMHPQPLDFNLPLPHPPYGSALVSTFSATEPPLAQGVVRLDLGTTKEPVWFPREGAVSYVPLKVKGEGGRNPRRFLMREVGGGSVRERVEDWKRWEVQGPQKGVHEGLYAHFQITKKEDWFKSLPKNPLGKGQVLTIAGFDDAEIRAGSKVVWQDGKKATAERKMKEAKHGAGEKH